jgi:hypothetical protein
MKKYIFNFLAALGYALLLSIPVHAQRAAVSVDNFSGSAGVNVPLLNLQYGSISVPIGISYNGGGVKVKESEGSVGMGWNMYAGGQVSRQVRGLPDDVTMDMMSEQRYGWLKNGNGTKINNFIIANDDDPSTSTDDYADFSYIYDNFMALSDTEPDIFYVSAPGLNCKLVFDSNYQIRTIPYQDIKVTYAIETTGLPSWESYGRIKSFTITTSAGLTYTFDKQEMTRKTTSFSASPGTIQFFKREFDMYKNGVNYASSWKLGTISDLTGHVVSFHYEEMGGSGGKDRLDMLRDSDIPLTSFTTNVTTEQTRLRLITDDDVISFQLPVRNNSVLFSYTNAETSGVSLLTGINGMGKNYGFGYVEAKTTTPTQKKTFLQSISGGGIALGSFEYYGLVDDQIALPDSTSKEIDQWGYYNYSGATTLYPNVFINPSTAGYELFRHMPGGSGSVYAYSLGGADRYTSSTYIANGSLKNLIYPEGGKTTITYEPNDYHDPTSGSVQVGGGVRVKNLRDHDAISTGNDMVTNYSYVNPATGMSSGKALSVPLFAFNTPFITSGTNESQWKNGVVRFTENISQENNAVAYSHVRVARSGQGSSLYEYALPATYWDSSAAPDWAPTIVNVTFPGGYVANERDAYPFIPNTNFDFERGLLNKITQFNENGEKVTESSYTYQRTNSPLVINAFKFDLNDGSMAYAKYAIYAAVGKLSTQVVNTIFDAPSTTQYNQNTTNYYYNGIGHQLPTLVQQTKSDGSISRNYTKYLKDYNVSSHADEQSTAMYNLQQLGLNFPIESYSQLEKNSVNKTIGASLVKLKPWAMAYSLTYNLPVQQLSLLRAEGITDFAPSNISGGNFVNDGRYVVKQNVRSYQQNGVPLSVDDNKHRIQTMLTNNVMDKTVATFGNANATEVAYNDFDYPNPASAFEKNVYLSGTRDRRSGICSDSLVVGNTFTRVITMTASRTHYIFSIWVKAAGSGSITLSLTNAASATSSYNLGFANTGGQWKYHQLKVPVGNISGTFTAQFQTNANIFIDDVLFYPADATVSTSGYEDVSHYIKASTNMNGQAQYFEHDNLGRVTKVLDQDKNIVLKKSYVSVKDQQNFGAGISASGDVEDMPTYFSDYTHNVISDDVVSYTWNFGDGSATVTNSNLYGSLNHTYANVGTYTVTLIKTSALLGTVTVTTSITITSSTSPTIISGDGDLVVRLFQGSSLIYELSGSSLYSGSSVVTPGVYDVQVSTQQYPYSYSNPTGFKKWETTIYNNATMIGQNCFPSTQNVRSRTQTYNLMPGLKYHFSISEYECVANEQ